MPKSIVSHLETFRLLVDGAPDATLADVESLFSAYMGLSTHTINIVSDLFSKVIRAALETNQGMTWYDLRPLQQQLVYEIVLYEKPFEPYLSIISKIRSVAREIMHDDKQVLPLSETERWTHAIQAARVYNNLYPDGYCLSQEKLRQHYAREYNVAEAAKRLSLVGFEISYTNGHFTFSEDGAIPIADRIEGLRREISGRVFGEKLFSILSRTYDASMGRYHLGRVVSSTGQNRDSSIPFGYLFQLAGKSIGRQVENSIGLQEQALANLIGIMKDLTMLLDVEPYVSIEMLGQTNETIVSFLRDIVLFDHLFTIRQLNTSQASKIIRQLFQWVDQPEVQSRLGFSIDDYANVMEKILELAQSIRGPVSFPIDNICTAIGEITPEKFNRVINVISRPEGKINANYVLPWAANDADYMFWPLVGTNDSRVTLLDGACNAPAFYEALAWELRVLEIPEADAKIGKALERLICEELSQHGIPVKSGEYQIEDVHGECDTVFETTDVVIFLEFKKKSLTRLSMAGDPIQVLIDLFGSLVDAQLQLGQHEIVLRKHQSISFTNGQTIELKGREIERLTITLLDFGGLQDRIILMKFLNLMTGSSIEATSSLSDEQQRSLAKLRKRCLELYTQLCDLVDLRAVNIQDAFFHCWFLSLPQLLTVLEGVSSPDEFKNNLWLTRSTTDGRLDFYYHYSRIKRMMARRKS